MHKKTILSLFLFLSSKQLCTAKTRFHALGKRHKTPRHYAPKTKSLFAKRNKTTMS